MFSGVAAHTKVHTVQPLKSLCCGNLCWRSGYTARGRLRDAEVFAMPPRVGLLIAAKRARSAGRRPSVRTTSPLTSDTTIEKAEESWPYFRSQGYQRSSESIGLKVLKAALK